MSAEGETISLSLAPPRGRNASEGRCFPRVRSRQALYPLPPTVPSSDERQGTGRLHGKTLHDFVETFDGFLGFGLDRKSDENTVQVYLQKFSDDRLMGILLQRMTDEDLEELFEVTGKMLRKYLTEPEYHHLFLKDGSR